MTYFRRLNIVGAERGIDSAFPWSLRSLSTQLCENRRSLIQRRSPIAASAYSPAVLSSSCVPIPRVFVTADVVKLNTYGE